MIELTPAEKAALALKQAEAEFMDKLPAHKRKSISFAKPAKKGKQRTSIAAAKKLKGCW